MTQNRTHASEHESGTFSGGYTAQTLCLPSKLAYKRQILEMSTSPRMNPIVWNFAVCAACCVIAPTQNVQYFVFLVPDKGPLNECVCLSFFGGGVCKTSVLKCGNFTVVHTSSSIHICSFKNGLNLCYNVAKRLCFWGHRKQKPLFSTVWKNLWGVCPSFLCDFSLSSLRYSLFCPNLLRFGEL